MYATVRRLKTQPGRAAEVGQLIQAEYVALLDSVDGFVTYTLVEIAEDEVTSLGVFETAESAQQANTLAKSWVADRLGPLVASPLEALEGAVLVHAQNT